MSKLNDDQFAKTEKAKSLEQQHLDFDFDLILNGRTKLAEVQDRIARMRLGLPGAQAFDGSRSGGGGGSPTERLLHDDGMPADPSRQPTKQIRAALAKIHEGAVMLDAVIQAYAPRPADAVAKKAAAVANINFPSCQHCTKWRKTPEPVYRTSDVGGRLSGKMALDRWCYDFVINTGDKGAPRLPYRGEVEKNDNGLVVRLPA